MIDDKTLETEGWGRRAFKGIPASLEYLWTQRDDNGAWRYAVKLDERHANAQGMIHGGVLMSFIDHAMSLILWELSGRGLCVTVHMDCHFLSALKPPAFVELDTVITKEGKSLIYARGIVRDGDKAIVEASGVWSVKRQGKG